MAGGERAKTRIGTKGTRWDQMIMIIRLKRIQLYFSATFSVRLYGLILY